MVNYQELSPKFTVNLMRDLANFQLEIVLRSIQSQLDKTEYCLLVQHCINSATITIIHDTGQIRFKNQTESGFLNPELSKHICCDFIVSILPINCRRRSVKIAQKTPSMHCLTDTAKWILLLYQGLRKMHATLRSHHSHRLISV